MRMNGINFYVMLEGLQCSEIWSNIARAILGRNFGVTIWRAAWEACSATWNLGTNSAFALGSRKTTENLDRVGRSQDLPDANWLLASSPTLNTRSLTSVLSRYFFIFKNLHVHFYTFYVHNLDEDKTFVHNISKEITCLYAHTCMQAYIYLYL
jgi:hypothetical protein